MILFSYIRSKSNFNIHFLISIFFSSTLLLSGETQAANDNGIGLQLPSRADYGIPLFDKQLEKGLATANQPVPPSQLGLSQYRRNVTIDSTGQTIAIEENFFGLPFYTPARYSLRDYLAYSQQENMKLLWRTHTLRQLTGERPGEEGRSGLEIAIPVRIKNRAFQTIFGGDRVSLSVTGQININGGFRHEKRSQVKTAYNRGSDYNFKMEQTQQFKVQGNVGDKVTVSVDQDSERPFDFENTVRLNYEGYDDEIIQSIQAGNISLSLPATRFVSFSAQNSGLFGIKSEAQIGNFYLTTIASQEKGENRTLSIKGGAEEGEYVIKDYNYMKGVYFFLDDVYQRNYTRYDENGNRLYDADKIITHFELYKSGPGYELKQGRIRGWALLDPTTKDTSRIDQENAFGYWIRMEPQKDYFLSTDIGKIKLYVPVGDNEMLAIAYRDTSGHTLGDVFFNPLSQNTIFLKMLKPQNPRPSDKTWNLMLRNVYYLGSRNIDKEGFEVKIFFDVPSGDDQESYGATSYLNIFGLDRVNQSGNPTPDNIIDDNSNFLRLGDGELEFPSLRPFADTTNALLPRDKYVSAMYDTTSQSYIANASKFYIQVKSKNRSANYDLGFNVIEGSEEVMLNGRRLSKDTDYIIDYYSGKLTILREEATNPAANVEVNYQRNEMFQTEKKTLLGMNGQYKFWENSFIGGTFLYLNQSTLDQKVRPDKGPMRNLIWDVNTSIKFEPNFLTKAIDAFPLIETSAPSRFNFEGEIAQILPNPNTLNNAKTGDDDGVAYVDDFEAAKRVTPLPVIYNGWRLSSSPLEVGRIPDPTNNWQTTFSVYRKMGRLFWYNPYSQVSIKEIWPNRDIHNPNTPQRVHVLNIKFKPAESTEPGYRKEQSWGGIMRWLSTGYADQSDSKFLEIWVKGDFGRLHIDLGQISEDVIPNGNLDTEDKMVNLIRNQLLDPGEDIGIDGMAGADPNDWWDINKNGVRDDGEPPSYDDWEYSTGSESYDRINGTENNERDPSGRLPDTEDMNANGSLDMRNDYFEYTFSLEKNHPDTAFIAGGQDNEYGWRMYRIPLNEYTKRVGEPDMSRIEYARIWIDSCSSTTFLSIAEINLVGNDWKEMGVAMNDQSPYDPKNDSTVVAAVTNTHDNDDYIQPPGVRGVIDRIYRIEAKEQSLVMKINNLAPGASGILRKTFFQAENYVNYKKMKMFVHGGDALGTNFSKDKTSIELFLRFGSDDNNFYEYRLPVFEGWEDNNIEIDLNDLAMLKLTDVDSLIGYRVQDLGNGRQYRIKGEPSLTNIRQLVLGVKNISNQEIPYSSQTYLPFTGEVWVNELRLSEVKKDRGVALRARVDLQLADVFSINGEINQKDADFHNVSQQFGSGDNEWSGNLSGNLSLNKFLPKSWGLSIPINFNYSNSERTPKYLPGSDIMVSDDMPPEEMQKIRSVSESRGFGFSFKKNTRSENFFIKHTIDQLSFGFNAGESHSTSSTQLYSDRTTYTANIGYSIPFPRDKYIRPFSWLGKAPIIKKLAEMQFFYWPTAFSVRASGNRSLSQSETRSGVKIDNQQFIISRDFQTGIQPFKSLTFDFSRSYKNDFVNSPDPMQELADFKFGELTDMDQSFSTKYNPQLVSWLKTNLSYTTNFKFTNNLQLKDRGRSAGNNTNVTASFNFDPDRLLKSIFKQTPPPRGGRTAAPPRPPAGKASGREEPKDQSKETSKDDKKEKSAEKGGGINPLKGLLRGVQFITGRIQPISINISNRKGVNNYGLDPAGGMPSTAYMFGQTTNPGMESVESVGTNKGSLNNATTIGLQSGINVMKQVDITLRYDQSRSKNATTTTTGEYSESWFYDSKTGGFRLPEWSIRWSGLEQIKFLKRFTQRVSFDHAFSGKKQESWQNTSDQITRKNYNKAFRPLAGFNISLKKNINVNIRYNWSEDISETVSGGSGGQKNVTSDLSVTASYARSGGFRIPIPVWPFKNKELKNNIDLQVTFSMNSNSSFQNYQGQDWVRTRFTEAWNFEPKMTYSFSQNVRGGMNFKIGKNKNATIGDTSIQEFGLNVSIAIRGN